MGVGNLLRSAALGALLAGASLVATAAPPAAPSASGQQAQARKVDADVAAARARQATLQAQVAQLEQRNAAERRQIEARDARIAELQRQLKAAGVPASAGSARD